MNGGLHRGLTTGGNSEKRSFVGPVIPTVASSNVGRDAIKKLFRFGASLFRDSYCPFVGKTELGCPMGECNRDDGGYCVGPSASNGEGN
mgnify:CR=1 FL=1